MKRLLVVLMLAACSMNNWVFAQTLSKEMQATLDACLQLRAAIGSGSMTQLKSANKAFKMCNVNEFVSLRCLDKSPLSLNGHFVFDEVFVDSLIVGRDVYKFAQRYAEIRGERGASSSGKIFARTCAVKKKSSAKYSFVSRGRQELAIVTEPRGMITLRIYDKTHDNWYNDTKDVKDGQPSRYMAFDLPTNEKSLLEIEIINTSENDISFVIISN